MRYLAFLILFVRVSVSSLAAQASDHDAKITIEQNQISIQQVLRQITTQSGFDFSYNSESVDVDQVISFKVKNASIERTLRTLGKIIDIDYVLVEDQIVLKTLKQPPEDVLKEHPIQFHVSGFVKEQATGESLIGATIMVMGTSAGVVTNAFGYYSLQLKQGRHKLSFSYLGYQSAEIDLRVDQDLKRDILLDYASVDLPDVVVALPVQQVLKNKDLGQMNLRPSELDNMPEFGGESGLVKGLQSLPGIKTHSDGSAFFYVRGGEKDQNLIIIDDAPIFNPSHLFGFYSMVIPEFTRDIQVYKSDIPVSLGDRLSSIISIRTKDGNLNRPSLSGSLNPLVNRFSFELPVVKGKSSIFASLRRSNFQWIIQESNPDQKLEFGDFNFKWNYTLNKKNRFFFTLITGVDALQNTAVDSSGVDWGNVATTLRWNHIFGPNLFSNTTLYSGSYRYRLAIAGNSWESAIGTISLKSDFTHFISNNVESRFGLEFSAFGFNPGKLSSGSLLSFIPDISAGIAGKRIAYYQTNVSLSSRWHLGAGFRLSTWANRGPAQHVVYDNEYIVQETVAIAADSIFDTHLNFDPRLSLQYFPDSTIKLKFSLGRYHQYLQLISNSVSPFTSLEVWLPSGPNISPQTAQEMSLSFLKYLPRSQAEFSVGGYYKKLENQVDYIPHANTFLNPRIEGELRFGKMHAYGLEFMIKKRIGKINGWINYTWSRALRQTKDINQGLQYPAFQDRPHDFSLLLNFQLAKRILCSTYYTAYTGSTFSAPTGFHTFNDQKIPIYQQKHNDRLPNYRRMDVAFKFTLNKNPTNRYQHNLTLSFYNVLRHRNIVAINFNKTLDAEGEPVVPINLVYERDLVTTQTDLIRFLPSLTYKFNW